MKVICFCLANAASELMVLFSGGSPRTVRYTSLYMHAVFLYLIRSWTVCVVFTIFTVSFCEHDFILGRNGKWKANNTSMKIKEV